MKATTTQAIHWLINGKYHFIRRHVIFMNDGEHGTLKDGRPVMKDSKGVWIIDEQGGGGKNGA